MDLFDSVRRRFSNSPSPSRMSSTPGTIRRPDSAASRLSKAEIDEILESPYETNYTYSDSVAYKPHIGSREYIHPRLCRRFPATPSPRPKSSAASWPFNTESWEWYRSISFTQALFFAMQFVLVCTFNALQLTFTTVYTSIYHFLRIATNVCYYTILAPVLVPYYAIRSYMYRAPFVWKTTHSIGAFLHWSWYWWTGQKVREELSFGVQTRAMARGRSVNVQHKVTQEITTKRYILWMFLYLPLLILLLWTSYRLLYPRQQIPLKESVQPQPQQPLEVKNESIKREEEGIPKISPSEQLPPHLAQPVAGPSLNVQKEIETAHKEGHHEEEPAQISEITSPYFPWFINIGRPVSRFTEIAAHLGQSATHGIGDIVLAFTTALDEMASAIFDILKQSFLFIWKLPSNLFSFLQKWIFIPLANFARNVFGATLQIVNWIFGNISNLTAQLWQFLSNWIFSPIGEFFKKTPSTIVASFQKAGHYIVEFPVRFWHFIRDWIFVPIGQLTGRIFSKLTVAFKEYTEFLAKIPTAIWNFLKDWVFSPLARIPGWIGTKLQGSPSAIATPFKWIWTKITNAGQLCWNAICAMFNSCAEAVGQFATWVKNGTTNAFGAIGQFFNWIGRTILSAIISMKDLFINSISQGFRLLGWTGEKFIDGIVFSKQMFVAFLTQIGDGIYWCAEKVGNGLKSFADSISLRGSEIFSAIAQYFNWTVHKVNSAIIWTVKSVFSISSNVYQRFLNIFVGIWHSAREFQFSAPVGREHQQPAAPIIKEPEPVEQILNRSPELGELPDDHPLVQKLRQIVLQALAEERHYLDHRIRKWVEHNVLVMKSQLQRLEPKLVEETKEKVEAEIFPPPPLLSDEELRGELRAELETKIRELLQTEKTEHKKEFASIEDQLNEKIRVLVGQLSTQIRTERAQMDKQLEQLKQKQQELEQSEVKRRKEESQQRGEPVVKQEKLTEKTPEGKEITRESTVLLHHIQRKIEEFDENALLEKVRKLVKRELRLYDSDRTGMPDFALESSGGSVLSTRCTVQYNERSRTAKLFGIPLWYTSYSPRTVIQRKGYGASAGECWAYHGGHGFLTVGLSKRINITAVSYEHLPVELSPDGNIRTAPKNFLVWSYQEVDDTNSRFLLGNFTYNAGGEPLQIFPVQQWDRRLSQIVELETLTNWGAPVTCLYRFRVHGDFMNVIPEATNEADLEALEANHLSREAHKTAKSVGEEQDLF